MSCIGTTISIFNKKIAKKIVPKFICMNFFFGKQDMQSFSKIIMLVHCISFAPYILDLVVIPIFDGILKRKIIHSAMFLCKYLQPNPHVKSTCSPTWIS
jgi:hypothetical protein